MRSSRPVTGHWAALNICQMSHLRIFLTRELTGMTCWPSEGQSTTESCQSEDISAAWLVSPLRGRSQVCSRGEECDDSTQRPGWGAEDTHSHQLRSGISGGISTTKSTFSRSICICNWFIHSMVSSVPFRIMSKCCHKHLMNNAFGSSFFVPLFKSISRVRIYVFHHFAWLTSINSLTMYCIHY